VLCGDVVVGILCAGSGWPHCAAYHASPGSTWGMDSADGLQRRGGCRGRAIVVFLLQERLYGLRLFQ